MLPLPKSDDRTVLYLRYLVERGMADRYGEGWETPERIDRLAYELGVIEEQSFSAAFVMLADILGFCRREAIPYGPGRGSVGGSYVAYAVGIHEVDSLEYGLLFERFLNTERVSFPDVDIDVSQEHRGRVIQHIVDSYNRMGQIVLQVGAFVRAGARAVIDVVLAARAQKDGDEAYAVATMLKKCLPDGANVTGGVKQDRELTWWLKFGHGDTDGFRRIAEAAGWMEDLLLLDGMFTHLGRHAAGVVILREEDLRTIPLLTIRNQDGSTARVTGYDMYALERLGYLKWDILGLRTLDVLAEAHRMIGGSGRTEDLMELWREHKDDPEVYELLTEADTVGIFQMETPGYRRVLKEFRPTEFVDIVHLNALYRPGALGYRERKADGSEGRNMVEIFIDRRHGRDPISYPDERLRPILEGTNGVLLFQEQTMRIARDLAGFTLAQADALRKAIGKKKPEEMAKLVPLWEAGTADMDPAVRDALWKNIDASSRYSWNMCLDEDTPIWTMRGLMPVKDVRPGDVTISFAGCGFATQPVKALHDNGSAESTKLILEDGTEIVATPNHRLLGEEGYKSVDQIGLGDRLQIAYDGGCESVKSFAVVVTTRTERHQIPGWIVVYNTPWDDVVHWQFVPSSLHEDYLAESADLAAEAVSFPNLVFRSVRPRISGDPWVTRPLGDLEIASFFRSPEVSAQHVTDACPVQSKAFAQFGQGPTFFQVELSDLRPERRWDAIMAVAFEAAGREEPAERGGAASEIQLTHDLLIRPAFPVEREDCSLALFKLGQLLRASGMSEDKPFGLSSDPSVPNVAMGGDGSGLAAAAFAEFWNVVHGKIVPGMRRVVKIEEAGIRKVYDLEMPEAHNFVANGIFSHNSHSYEYGIITCLCAILKSKLALPGLDGVPKHGFYGAEINSWDDKKDRQAGVIAEARRHARFMPPDANLAEDRFVLADDSSIVFGLNGIKGMGEANRSAILIERTVGGPFESYADFCARLPQVPTNMKRSLIACGAFDSLGESRTELLSTLPKGNRRWRVGLLCGCETTKNSPVDVGDELRCARCKHKTAAVAVEEVERKRWAVLEQINEDAKRALEGKGRTSPQPWEAALDGELLEPSAAELGDGEMQAIGHYITEAPMRPVLDALRRVEVAGTIGGEVASVEWRKDKNDNDYANVQLTLPDLTRQRVLAFHSVVALHRDKIEPRSQLLFRGKDDGDTFIANSCWVAGDYRHFMKVRLRNLDGEQEVRNFDGKTETIERLEAEGWRVTVI